MAQHAQAGKASLGLAQPGRRGIGRTIVQIDDLELPAALEGGVDFLDQREDVLRFVANRHDDREHERAIHCKKAAVARIKTMDGRNRTSRAITMVTGLRLGFSRLALKAVLTHGFAAAKSSALLE